MNLQLVGRGRHPRRVRRENETLYAVIKTVSSSLDLDRVLRGIVDIANDATGCHACFIYFLEGDRLVLRAASPRYSGFVGELGLSVDEGLAGWVARTKTPEFIRENAMADPRMKFVPELEEEDFQSMVAVPILAKSGDVIGVVVLHTEAPREFDDDVLNFLVHTASLVGGAIENAQLYEETTPPSAGADHPRAAESGAGRGHPEGGPLRRGRARRARAAAGGRLPDLPPGRRGRRADAGALRPRRARPRASARPGGTALVLDLMRRANGRGRNRRRRVARELWPDVDEDALLVAPLVARDEQLGVLCCMADDRLFTDEDAELLGAVANQTAVGLKKAELIERLTAENIVKDMFDALAAGSLDTAEAKASETRCDLGRPHLFLHAERAPGADDAASAWPELAARLETRLRKLYPRALFDSRHDRVRALVPLPNGHGAGLAELRADMRFAGPRRAARGRPQRRGQRRVRAPRRRMREAADAARIGRSLVVDGGAVSYEQLGAYRYLVHLELDEAPRDRYRQSVEGSDEYDRRRGSQLVETLEQFLADRGSVTASARALYVHPNTVRQRLERIERVAELDLPKEDLLSLELALKLARLHHVRTETE